MFVDNKSLNGGGAIFNKHNHIEKIENVVFKNNSTQKYGGAIYNYAGGIGSISADFINNSAYKDGGALYYYDIHAWNGPDWDDPYYAQIYGDLPEITSITGNFINNSAGENGGAIAMTGSMSTGYIGEIDANFIGNAAKNGGAIYNNGIIGKLQGNLIDNIASEQGGALYNCNTDVTIFADSKNTVFTGNMANGASNAIHNEGWIYLYAGDKKIQINDAITGVDGVININNGSYYLGDDLPTHGTIEINNTVSGNEINLYNGTLKLSTHTYDSTAPIELQGQTGIGFFDSSVNFHIHGGHITTIDNQINNHNLGNVTLENNATMSLDANLNTEKMDTISMDSFSNTNSSTIDINKINIIEPTTKQQLELSLFDSNVNQAIKEDISNSIIYSGGEIAYSPIYKYDVEFDNIQGNFKFTSLASSNSNSSTSNNFNPSILSTPTSTQLGGFTTQVNTYNEAFSNMDTFMARDVNERIMMKYAQKYASNTQNNNNTIIDSSLSSDINYDEYLRRNNKEGWLRPYVTFEKVPLKNGPKVTNIGYGSYFGANSKLYSLKHGWDASWGGYFGYLGSRQKYDNVTTNQNGATIGLVGELYKNNFFTGLTINTGASMGKSHTMYGEDNFEMLTAGVASKSGYNFEFKKGKYIIQPNFLASYSFVNTFDYTTKSGVKIKSEPLNAIQIEPGLKFIANLENGWKPYAQVSMIWNFLNKTDVKANDVKLPEMSIKPYVRYGIGLQKSWKDRFSGFTQAFVTNGGRNGVGLQAGFSWMI